MKSKDGYTALTDQMHPRVPSGIKHLWTGKTRSLKWRKGIMWTWSVSAMMQAVDEPLAFVLEWAFSNTLAGSIKPLGCSRIAHTEWYISSREYSPAFTPTSANRPHHLLHQWLARLCIWNMHPLRQLNLSQDVAGNKIQNVASKFCQQEQSLNHHQENVRIRLLPFLRASLDVTDSCSIGNFLVTGSRSGNSLYAEIQG